MTERDNTNPLPCHPPTPMETTNNDKQAGTYPRYHLHPRLFSLGRKPRPPSSLHPPPPSPHPPPPPQTHPQPAAILSGPRGLSPGHTPAISHAIDPIERAQPSPAQPSRAGAQAWVWVRLSARVCKYAGRCTWHFGFLCRQKVAWIVEIREGRKASTGGEGGSCTTKTAMKDLC